MTNRKMKQIATYMMIAIVTLTGLASTVVTVQSATTTTVSSQKQLNRALKNSKVKSITIKTDKKVTLKIKSGDYDKKKLIINAPKSTINNYGHFDEVAIREGSVFYDRGYDNDITISDTNKLKLVAGINSYDTEVEVTSSGGKIAIVNNGGIEDIEVKGCSEITLSGKNTGQAVEVENDASGTKFTTSVKTKFSLDANATILLKKGAEGSSVEIDESSVKVSVTNNTIKSVTITDDHHNTTTIAAGKKL